MPTYNHDGFGRSSITPRVFPKESFTLEGWQDWIVDIHIPYYLSAVLLKRHRPTLQESESVDHQRNPSTVPLKLSFSYNSTCPSIPFVHRPPHLVSLIAGTPAQLRRAAHHWSYPVARRGVHCLSVPDHCGTHVRRINSTATSRVCPTAARPAAALASPRLAP